MKRCEHCGKLIPYMYYFCNECTEKLLGEAPKPFKPPIEKEEKMSEIIKCKDCKYFQKWRYGEAEEKYGQIYDCSLEVLTCPEPDDYCSKAERKEVSREDKLIDLANAIESDDNGWWTKKRILSALRNI